MSNLSKLLSVLILLTLLLLGNAIISDKPVITDEIAMPVQINTRNLSEITLSGTKG